LCTIGGGNLKCVREYITNWYVHIHTYTITHTHTHTHIYIYI